jgi:hypothetical protein
MEWTRIVGGHYLSHDGDYKIVRSVYGSQYSFELFHWEGNGVHSEWVRVPSTFTGLLRICKILAEEHKWMATVEK